MSSRAGLRLLQTSRLPRVYRKFSQGSRRFQTTDAATATEQSFAQRIWNSPVGVKTVHFWAPVMKWALVLTGVSDFARPAEKLSLTQNVALMATGAIWTRWCFVIRPKNVLLAAVNFFLFCVGSTQVSRIMMFRQSQKTETVGETVKKEADNITT